MPALRDGRRVEIRVLGPEDEDELLAPIGPSAQIRSSMNQVACTSQCAALDAGPRR